MKGFIEVTTGNYNTTYLISVDSILRIINTTPVMIFTKELTFDYDSGGNSRYFEIQETYEEIKQLIKDAQ